ncbi:FAS1-like dehydratase domain-containing protein [Phenylobacterium sp.]|uniref:FAS1-like dehydratase domain-containing protein n=1 Tax=Phenylobacterium sp. TaxID=1871053 RepID=UPI002E358059|nr:MaoC family dehydratase N-terminal domain-containing protein [Phenylobacterium sp.]HEX3367261.1 MaoC family dehydratase N-terminal domain-containing protein [Phenylobacterium sp.]
MTSEALTDDYWLEGRITDEGLAKMHAELGRKRQVPGWNSEVTRDNIWHFALGVGDDNPLWWDEVYAKASPWGRLIAPPYYILSHTTGPLVKPEHGQMSTAAYLPGVMGIYAGSRWEWRRPVHVGEKISATAELDSVQVNEGSRFGGRSVTQVEKLQLSTDEGEVVAEIFHTLKRFERQKIAASGGYLDRPLATYTAQDRERLEAHYDREAATLRRGAEPRYVEDVVVGETLGPMLKGPLTVSSVMGFILGYGSQMLGANRMAHDNLKLHPSTKVIHPVNGVADQYGAVHWDADLARAGGMPAAYDIGPQRFSWFTHLLTDWAGDAGFLVSQDFRFKTPNFMGDVTWITGEVTEVDAASGLVTIKITGTNQLEVVNSTAVAKVRLPRRTA